ncbi:MAG: hypothetical protein UV00_C0009G0018 [candidate division WWE3 bacterium GW2011_GWF1_42_14]|uniref:Uncharacterized protein n=2 Tax=Katanobacteria TaxID=422282 RepID=A0A0G0YN65_UNCKA|nr:MAG: hypothetical protein UU92_C0002G0018 [candidate division WWE3 bacterium GW2011_GWA1_42_12]KKS38069.1 MAG: hypothetical protein UV00_C0009G0018 [candidate division WWE3 bacterium GW2011_GWF1_42_14]KKS40383.1 MAG: hypothetical protein UV03_C0007G0018 [candidate division WWE3 bacterium GW2011_GWE1_42_16]KKS66585.1 MAG: hypothetical protein UV35_C0011G0018 [candidate division WWE3 bacterium GW2011_GWB1_42_6]
MDRKKFNHVKKNGRRSPGSRENPVSFNGVAACRSELLSNLEYNKGIYILVGERAVYQITGYAQECSGRYTYSYSARPVGFI